MAGDDKGKKKGDKSGDGVVSGISDIGGAVGDLMEMFADDEEEDGEGEADHGDEEEEGEPPDAQEHLKHGIGAMEKSQKMAQNSQKLGKAVKDGKGASAATGLISDGLGQDAKNLEMLGKLTNDEGIKDAAKAVGEAGKVVGVVSKLYSGVEKFAGSLKSSSDKAKAKAEAQTRRVVYEVRCEEVAGDWRVSRFDLTEELNRPYECVLKVTTEDRDADPAEFLGRDIQIELERGEHLREVCGLVRRVVVEEAVLDHHQVCTLHVVPALWLLGQERDTQFFPDKTVREILQEVLELALGPYRREIEFELEATYVKREHCVQYRESYLDFVHRLCEEEGIGYYFEAQDGREKLVFFDTTRGVEAAPTMDDGPVAFDASARVVHSREPISDFHPADRLGATAYSVRDHDWTKLDPRVDATRDGEDVRGRSRQVYDHGIAAHVSLTDYREPSYEGNDVGHHARVRHELLIRDRRRGQGAGRVIGFAPGRTFELTGHPTLGADGEYLLTKVVHSSRVEAPDGGEHAYEDGDNYQNRFECQPKDVVWRPDRITRKPRIYGAQTARVSGPQGDEIYTDVHGRIKVAFPWNRSGGLGESTSCWIRVSQVWAGSNYPGFVFLPRIGMEVIVTFIDGDPDRPLVTGCVYNRENPTPEQLAAEKTKSIIRTRSTPNGEGYNELSFEDAAGNEEVHLRAERNLRELVQHDHTTNVHANQSNRVGGTQEIHVEGAHRHVHVDQVERYEVDGNRHLTVGGGGGMHEVIVHGPQSVQVDSGEIYTVDGHRRVTVGQGNEEAITGGSRVTVAGGVTQTIQNGGWRMTTTGNVSHNVTGGMIVELTDSVTISAGAGVSVTGATGVDVHGSVINAEATTGVKIKGPSKIALTSETAIHLLVGGSEIRISRSKIEINSPTVEINGTTEAKVDGGQVKLKC